MLLRIGGQEIQSKTLALVGSDMLIVGVGLGLATFARFYDLTGCRNFLSEPQNIWRLITVIVICAVALYYNDLYDVRSSPRRSILFLGIAQSVGTACLILALLYFLFPSLTTGRGIALLAAPIIITLLVGWRTVLEWSGIFGNRPERVLIVGTGSMGITLAREVCTRSDLRLNILGFLDERGENIGQRLVNPGIIGGVDELTEIVAREKVKRVVLALNDRRGFMPVRELLMLRFAGVVIEDAHTLFEKITGRIMLDRLSPSWLILSEGFRKSELLLLSKRMLDILAALIGLIITLPIMALVACAIWVESGRPIIFRQRRVGLHGREFEVLKFRSMYQNAEAAGPAWASDSDPRITRVGRLIRMLRMDELPQFVNVLRGDMSLVGPRPEQPHFCDLLTEQIPFFAQRHAMRPGITGWAQIKYQYGSSIDDARRKLELDLFYIKHRSLTLDFAIILETIKVVLLGRGAK